MTELLKRLWPEEQAEGLFEYALLLLLVSMTAVTAVGGLASAINNYYSSASTRVEATGNGGSLASGSLGYGVQPHTDTATHSKDQKSPNTE
jgi:Flp pilus assembly pilin Flp